MGMMGLGFASLFVFLAAPLVLAWLPLLLWRLLGNRRRAPAQPACARCFYPTATLTSSRCPECGADLLREGVITPAMRVRQGGGVLLAASAWTILVGIAALVAASWAAFAIPTPLAVKVSINGTPAAGQYRDFDLRGSVETDGRFFGPGYSSRGPAHLTLVVHSKTGERFERTFIREGGETNFRLDDGRVTNEFSFDGLQVADVVEEVLVAAGAAPDAQSTVIEAAEIAGSISGGMGWWGMQGSGTFAAMSNATTLAPMDTVLSTLAALAPFGVLLLGAGAWLAGIIILFNQHAKRFRPRRPAPEGPDAPTSTQDAPAS